jgi:hypothetical protein
MRLFALGDPHLSFDREGKEYKPMGIFGDSWQNHGEKIRQHWLEQVTAEDVVLLPGDISWAMTLEELQPDLDFLAALPGKKIISKGNHDLWWDSLRKLKKILPADFAILQNNSYLFGDVAVCGTRGWICPEGQFADEHDTKIFQRELGRLRLSLDSVPKDIPHKIVMLHYPPINSKQEKSAFVELMAQYDVALCLYGHLHSYAVQNALEGQHWDMEFQLVSADYLGFTPKLIWQL